MVRIRVFLGAPSPAESGARDGHVWQTVRESLCYPPATLDAASRRVSFLYRNVIFGDDQDDEQTQAEADGTFVTWPPTGPPAADTTGGPSFLRPSGSLPCETQQTGSSIDYSDASSIARFPDFQFSLHSLTPLSALYHAAKSGRGSRKVNVLLVVLEVQGPDAVRVKKGPDAGQEVSILKLILGDDQGSVCKLTAWRDTAEAWGGYGPTPVLTRGDVLFLQNLVATWEPGSTVTLTASPYNKPSADICYRTMPCTHRDNKLRPDLRLGNCDAAVSKVAALVRWFQEMAGLPGL